MLRRSFCADLYRCASGPILFSVLLFIKVVGTKVFQLWVIISSLSGTSPENETMYVAILTVWNIELQRWIWELTLFPRYSSLISHSLFFLSSQGITQINWWAMVWRTHDMDYGCCTLDRTKELILLPASTPYICSVCNLTILCWMWVHFLPSPTNLFKRNN